MRMVKTHDAEAAAPGFSTGVEMILWIDDETASGLVSEIAGANGCLDVGRGAEQHATAFFRQDVAGVRRDRLEYGQSDGYGYKASTAIAMPIPPPMQSEATP